LIKRANIKGKEIPLDLTFEQYKELIASEVCHYCGDALPDVGFGLDRKDSSLGYNIGNCVPCCTACNKIRGDNLILYEEMLHMVGPMLRKRLEHAPG
jgi:hypothetical protein